MNLKRVQKICNKPIGFLKGQPVFGCRFLLLQEVQEGRLINFDENIQDYPNLASMTAQDFVDYFLSMRGTCKQCDTSTKRKKFPLCYKHELLLQKISYIVQEICKMKLGLQFNMNRHGPTSETIHQVAGGGTILDNVLNGKVFRIETLTMQESDLLRTLVGFFSKWNLGELELLTTEHFMKRSAELSPGTITLDKQTVRPFVELAKRFRGLRGISRWQQIPVGKSENLAEHTGITVLLSMILCDILLVNGINVNVEKVLRKAAMHDLEEIPMGFDAPTPTKYRDRKTYETFKKTGELLFREMISKVPEKVRKTYLKVKAEEDSLEDSVVQIADKLDALLFAIEQLNMGNSYFKPVIDNKISFLRNFKDSRLKPLIDAMLDFLDRQPNTLPFYS